LLNASSVLFGTIGGIGSLVAHLVSPQIRAYNRFSIYISFFSLFTVALLLDRLARKIVVTNFRQVLYSILILLLILIGVLDQTANRLLPDFNETKVEYQRDRKFIGQIEAMVPPNTMIFQLPVQTFPEGESYRHLRGYLHAKSLRWSFGAMRQRRGDQWQKTVAAMSPHEMIDTLIAAGFGGVYIDRLGYADKGVKIESDLSALLLSHPAVNDKKDLAFFNLTEYLQSENSAVDWNERRENALNPLRVSWQADFYGMEGTSEDNWRWCTQNGRIELENSLSRPRKVKLDMSVSTLEEGTLRIESRFFNEQLRINPTPT